MLVASEQLYGTRAEHHVTVCVTSRFDMFGGGESQVTLIESGYEAADRLVGLSGSSVLGQFQENRSLSKNH